MQTREYINGKYVRKYKPVVGQKYGFLTVLADSYQNADSKWVALCSCECGKQKEIREHKLCGKRPVSSCGCKMGYFRNKREIGQKFGHWTILSEPKKDISTGKVRWLVDVECICGKKATRLMSSLGKTSSSCGCVSREKTVKTCTTHGGRRTRLYKIWEAMKRRCFNEKDKSYHRYGGRGITVCDEWIGFDKFRLWANSNKYEDNLTIDRINSDGNYEPSNCEWVSIQENARRVTGARDKKIKMLEEKIMHLEAHIQELKLYNALKIVNTNNIN